MFVAFLRLPLSAIIVASVLCASAGAGAGPLIIVGVVVAYLATLAIEGRVEGSADTAGEPTDPNSAPESVSDAVAAQNAETG